MYIELSMYCIFSDNCLWPWGELKIQLVLSWQSSIDIWTKASSSRWLPIQALFWHNVAYLQCSNGIWCIHLGTAADTCPYACSEGKFFQCPATNHFTYFEQQHQTNNFLYYFFSWQHSVLRKKPFMACIGRRSIEQPTLSSHWRPLRATNIASVSNPSI